MKWFVKTSKLSIKGPKMANSPWFGYNNHHSKPLVNVCHQVHFWKNQHILRKLQICQFWAQKCPIYPVLGIITISLKIRNYLTLNHFLMTERKVQTFWFRAHKRLDSLISSIIRIFIENLTLSLLPYF